MVKLSVDLGSFRNWDRIANGVEYYCFFIINIVSAPNLLDTVLPLKYTHFLNFIRILHSSDVLANLVVVVLQVFFDLNFARCVGITNIR